MNLREYRPSLEVLQEIRREITNCGLDVEDIPMNWLEIMVAATAKWMSTSEKGAQTFAKLMSFQTTPGDKSKKYNYYPETWDAQLDIKAENIHFFRGVFINHKPADWDRLDVREKAEENCEGCGIISHCTQLIHDPASTHLTQLCNNCIISHENPRVYDQGDRSACYECPKNNCSNHPYGQREELRRFMS